MRAVVMKMARVLSSAGRSFEKTWRGLLVAALAFVCGAALVYALRRAPQPKPAASPAVPAMPCAAVAPPVVTETVTASYDEEEWDTPELQEWKNRNNGVPLPLDYDPLPSGSKLSASKVVILPSGRTLAAAGNGLYMLDAGRRVVWKYEVTQEVYDFAYVRATGLVYVTAQDNNFIILDAATGRELFVNSRQGRGGYGAVLPYGEDVCLVMDALAGYRSDYRGVEASRPPMQDGVTAWRGTRMLWQVAVPPDAELQLVGSKIYAVTKTRTRILVREIKVPKQR